MARETDVSSGGSSGERTSLGQGVWLLTHQTKVLVLSPRGVYGSRNPVLEEDGSSAQPGGGGKRLHTSKLLALNSLP